MREMQRTGTDTLDHSFVQNYLAKWKRTNVITCWIVALGAFGLGLVVLFLTFWFTYAIIFIGALGISALWELFFNHKLFIAHETRLIGSGIFLVLLFIQYFRTDPSYWKEDLARRDNFPAPGAAILGGQAFSLLSLLAHPGSSRVIADLLLCGPRLLDSSRGFLGKAAQIRKLDVFSCSNLLTFLLHRGRLVPYGELYGVGWEAALEQLRNVEGVNFFEKGLTLSEDLRTELCGEKLH